MTASASRRSSLRAQLVGAFVVAAIVPTALVLALRTSWSADADKVLAERSLSRSASLLQSRVDGHLDQQARALAGVGEALARAPVRPIAGQPVPPDLGAWLAGQAAHQPAFRYVLVADTEGAVVAVAPAIDATSMAALLKTRVADRDYFREPMRTGQPFTTGLFLARVSFEPVMLVSAPIVSGDGRPAGVVAGVLKLEPFEAFAREVRPERSRVELLDPSGQIVATTDAKAAPAGSAARASATKVFLAASTPTDGTPFWYDTVLAETRLASSLKSARGWRAVVDMPHAAVYANTSGSTLTTLLVVACGLGIGSVIMGRLARRLTRPLEGLAAAAQKLGDDETPLPEFDDAPDEVARLAADFSRMATRVTAMRASLEQQVLTRTAELSEARDRAEREARLKSGFLAAMSHEIRTPMNSIVGMAELMAETPLDSEQREYCDTIRTSTDALLGVINDILDFSKIESQGVSLETLDFDLRLVVEDAVELLAVKAAAGGLDLAALVEPGFDGRFRGDPSRLRQVVVNLLGNAVKFTREGSVTVRVATVTRDADTARVRLEVVDTGIGIRPEGLARLFRPFSQAEESTTRQYGGTGLGLTISKQIVERMGGEIGVTSELGRGTTFWVEIPFPRSAALPAPAASAPAGGHALLVEPLDASADALGRLLAEQGVRVTRVAGGAEVRAALTRGSARVDFAFVSVDAPDLGACAEALQAGRGEVPIAALVPSGRRAAPTDLDRQRPAHRLTRPIRRARLVECLDALRSQRPAPLPVPEPEAEALPAAKPAASQAPAAGRLGPRVLVADDYPANQRLVTRLLEKRGCTVETVSDGSAAVEAALGQRFDVVLMDCNMPILDGYEATARIRAGEQGRRTPILAMTAADSPEDRKTCLAAGMDDYLVKPIQAALVIAAVERWAGSPPLVSAPAAGGQR